MRRLVSTFGTFQFDGRGAGADEEEAELGEVTTVIVPRPVRPTVLARAGTREDKLSPMKYFAISYDYDPQDPRLEEVRPRHREFTSQLFDAGQILGSGPHPDSRGGALIIVQSDNEETTVADIEKLMDADPYRLEGVLNGRDVREWTPVRALFG